MPNLSIRLREETREEHRRAERTSFSRRLVGGDASVEDFLRLFRALQPVYRELEEALEHHRAHPAVAPVRFPELYRSTALAKDVALLRGLTDDSAGWTGHASEAYVTRIRSVAEHDPGRLAAHAYVRFMGDLSGGQLIGRRLREAIGTGGARPAFPVFEVEGGVDHAKGRFREGLDTLAATACVDEDGVVEEARQAFALNRSLFEGLGRVGSTPGPS